MGNEPTLLFCVGATKAGTSWFHRYLEGHPDCHMRGVKELHYFDALDLGNSNWQARRIERNRDSLQARLDAGQTARPKVLRRRIDAHGELLDLHRAESENASEYLTYLNKGRDGQTLVADVTPAYGLLSADRIARMAAITTNVRFIYILRDPVARLWSHIRMLAARSTASPARMRLMVNRIFWRFGRGRFPAIRERGDYRATLEKLDTVLGPGQLFTVFYEELFSQKTTRQICEFLGIGNAVARPGKIIHAGAKADMNADMVTHAKQWLAPQYEFVRQWSGYLPSEWQVNAPAAQPPGAKMLGVNT